MLVIAWCSKINGLDGAAEVIFALLAKNTFDILGEEDEAVGGEDESVWGVYVGEEVIQRRRCFCRECEDVEEGEHQGACCWQRKDVK